MRHWRIWLYLVGMVAILFSCFLASNPNALNIPRDPTKVVEAPQTEAPTKTAVPVTEVAQAAVEPAGEETEAPTEAPAETEVAVADQVDQCIECHTDKDLLIDTADPEEEVVEESEGAG